MSAQWVLDRFTHTYFDDWSSDSLRLEWRYQHGQRPGPCASDWMSDRPVNVTDVATALAERYTTEWEQKGTGAERSGVTADDFTVIAVENIEAGQPEVAVRIFEGYVRFDPANASANNNYGFCLLSTDPARGYEFLQRAEQLGYHSLVTNAADRVLALYLLGRDGEAAELAQATLSAGHDSTPAYVWELRKNGELRLVRHPDVLLYIQELLALINSRQSDTPGEASAD